MKHEWRRHEKDLYGAKQFPRIVNIPAQQFIMADGKGNPNGTDFSAKVTALYSLAYAIKMIYKDTSVSGALHDYTVYPLETFWKKADTKKPDEPVSFQKMDLFAKENNLKRSDNYHKEIYLNHENHAVKSKLKTILRYCVE